MKHRLALAAVLTFFAAAVFTGCAEEADSSSAASSAAAAPASSSAAATVPTPAPTPVAAASPFPVSDKNTLLIGEKLFITQINDMYYNIETYQEKTVIIEGMYTLFKDEETYPDGVPLIFRYGPGCCTNDGWGGFFLNYGGEMPKENDWIRVTGKPKIVINGYYHDLYLDVERIEVLAQRGAETVTQ